MEAHETVGQPVPTDTITTMAMLECDPASVYRKLRKDSPVVRIAALGRIAFTKATDTYRIKSDTEHFGCFDPNTPMQRAFRGHTLMRKDGPEHLKERNAMSGAFSSRTVHNQWRAEFETIVDDLLEELPANGTVDFVKNFADPLAARCLQRVLGVDNATEEQLLNWAPILIQGAMNAQFHPEVFALNDAANDQMDTCFKEMTKRLSLHPNSSILSEMVNASEPLPFSQIGTNMRVCLAGSLVESRDGLLSTLIGILSDRDQKEYCVQTNSWRAACEEGLRWMAPIQANARVVVKSAIVRGYHIPKGETVMVLQGSANHDEDIWDQPERFDARRLPISNQTFGNGPHTCPGADIYKLLVGDVLLPRLFDRFPQISLENSAEIVFRGFAFRGPTSCSICLG